MRYVFIAMGLLGLLSACATGSGSGDGPEAKTYLGPKASHQEVDKFRLMTKTYELSKFENVVLGEDKIEKFTTVFEALKKGGTPVCEEVRADQKSCDWISLKLNDSVKPNSYAWGYAGIVINTGILVYAENDNEMAYLLSHEMAHQLTDHVEENADYASDNAKAGTFLIGVLLCGVACTSNMPNVGIKQRADYLSETGKNSFNEDQEREADYIAAYLMKHAGYDIDKGRMFLVKMAALKPSFGEKTKDEAGYFDTHSYSSKKPARLTAVMKEMEKKEAGGMPVIPNGVVGKPTKDYYY